MAEFWISDPCLSYTSQDLSVPDQILETRITIGQDAVMPVITD